ncbi:uncharacterized protein LOC131428537 isoform X1 [Malaya genurostris]|uniref:uncharacterized protein LOC131428537 isoform X1 n=1 Tax=Malaya genurostris TaxID=325434 RepID=UPI0026F3D71A|nr:uncharacterized protein LOC131428537 isoform X1 [Malaya genurostris]
MGRKRKSKAPVKITRSPKQAKQSATPVKKDVTSTDDGSNNPVKKNSPKVSDPVQLDDVTEQQETADGKKSWDRVRQWMIDQQQQQADEPDAKVALEEIADEEPLTEDRYPLADDSAHLNEDFEVPLRYRLKDYTEKQILNSVMYECEWLKCGLETTDDIEYLTHVESHLDSYLQGRRDFRDLTCLWDLCDFKTSSVRDLESHVHFHVYHNRMKTHGASLSNIISVPKCNNDSRRRNSIDTFRITFQCEWGDCEEVYHKAQSFFTHVNNHIQDQFPVDKRSSKVPLMCQWAACKQTYKRCSIGLEHIRRHSTERTIGCYTCGAMFVSRLKYIDHCKRQVEYHNREYPCQQCNKLFATKQLMVDHTNIHNKKYACTLCPMKWPSRKALSYHIRYRHVEDKPFQCHICNHRAVTARDLHIHTNIHANMNQWKCFEVGCKMAYKSEITLRKHILTVHKGLPPDIYACHLCTKEYKCGTSLSNHLMKYHGCERLPGHIRYQYRQDHEDEKFKLAVYLDNKIALANREQVAPRSSNEQTKLSTTTESDSSGFLDQTTWTSYSIESWKHIDKDKISINMIPDKIHSKMPRKPRTVKPKVEKDDSLTESLSIDQYAPVGAHDIEETATRNIERKVYSKAKSKNQAKSRKVDDCMAAKKLVTKRTAFAKQSNSSDCEETEEFNSLVNKSISRRVYPKAPFKIRSPKPDTRDDRSITQDEEICNVEKFATITPNKVYPKAKFCRTKNLPLTSKITIEQTEIEDRSTRTVIDLPNHEYSNQSIVNHDTGLYSLTNYSLATMPSERKIVTSTYEQDSLQLNGTQSMLENPNILACDYEDNAHNQIASSNYDGNLITETVGEFTITMRRNSDEIDGIAPPSTLTDNPAKRTEPIHSDPKQVVPVGDLEHIRHYLKVDNSAIISIDITDETGCVLSNQTIDSVVYSCKADNENSRRRK